MRKSAYTKILWAMLFGALTVPFVNANNVIAFDNIFDQIDFVENDEEEEKVKKEFEIETESSTMKVGESTDLTIKAVDSNGKVINDFEWDIFMMIEWEKEEVIDEFPGDGEYDWFFEFEPENQWKKKFLDWLTFWESSDITDKGHFTISVELLEDPEINWTKDIEVKPKDKEEEFDVRLISPLEGERIKWDKLKVSWLSTATNNLFEVILNGEVVREDLTNDNWGFDASIEDIEKWKNTLEIKIYDVNNNVIAESGEIEFKSIEHDFDDALDEIDFDEEDFEEDFDEEEEKVEKELEIKTESSTMKVGESTDLTIKAVDSNGEVIDDFEWDVYLTFKNLENKDAIKDFPWNGKYDWFFKLGPKDQWKKKFLDWLTFWESSNITDKGHFTISAELLEDPEIKWTKDIEVKPKDKEQKSKIHISSPTDWEKIEWDTIDITWRINNSKIMPYKVFINDEKYDEGFIWSNWKINASVHGIEEWVNTLQVKAYDFEKENVIAKSDEITFESNYPDIDFDDLDFDF